MADLDRSIRFYCDVVGAQLLRPPHSGDSTAFSGRMAVVAPGQQGLDILEHADNNGEQFDPVRTGLDHIALTAASHDELQKWANWLDSQNVPRSAMRDILDFGAMFNFADPDGVQIEFIFLDPAKRQQSTALA